MRPDVLDLPGPFYKFNGHFVEGEAQVPCSVPHQHHYTLRNIGGKIEALAGSNPNSIATVCAHTVSDY